MYIRAGICSEQKEPVSGGGSNSGSGEGRDPRMWKERVGWGRTRGGKEGGGESGGCTRKMELLGDQWPAGIFTTILFPLPPLDAIFPVTHCAHDTYFSLACESEGTDDPFPFAYIVVVVAGQFFPA